MINIKSFDSFLLKKLKIDKNIYKNSDIYYIGYITIKDFDYVNIQSVIPLYFIIGKVDGYIEEKNRNKYLISNSIDKNKEVFKNFGKTQNFGIKLKI